MAAASELKRSRLPVEVQLLLACTGNEGSDPVIRQLLTEPVDWARLFALVRNEGATAHVCRRISDAGNGAVPHGFQQRLENVARIAEFRMLYLKRRLHEVVTTLSEANIRVVLLKGAALTYTHYSASDTREMSDIDLLVEPGRARDAQALLQKHAWATRFDPALEGIYENMHHLPPLVDSRATELGIGLELHTDIVSPGSNPFRAYTSKLFDRAVQLPTLPPGVMVPDRTDQLVHLCIHYAWSHIFRWSAWRTFRDLREISKGNDVDWPDLLHRAEETRSKTCCYWTLHLASVRAGIVFPAYVLKALRPDLPNSIHTLVERHLLQEAFESDHTCPSFRLKRLFWQMAIQPGHIGHGDARPWTNDTAGWLAMTGGDGVAGKKPGRSRSVTAWLQYAQQLLVAA
jgi:hypothetical protein